MNLAIIIGGRKIQKKDSDRNAVSDRVINCPDHFGAGILLSLIDWPIYYVPAAQKSKEPKKNELIKSH